MRSAWEDRRRRSRAVLLSALGGTRTPDLLVRSEMLYPIELRALVKRTVSLGDLAGRAKGRSLHPGSAGELRRGRHDLGSDRHRQDRGRHDCGRRGDGHSGDGHVGGGGRRDRVVLTQRRVVVGSGGSSPAPKYLNAAPTCSRVSTDSSRNHVGCQEGHSGRDGCRRKSPGAAGKTGGTDNSARLGRPEPRWVDARGPGSLFRTTSARCGERDAHPGCAVPVTGAELGAEAGTWREGGHAAPDGRTCCRGGSASRQAIRPGRAGGCLHDSLVAVVTELQRGRPETSDDMGHRWAGTGSGPRLVAGPRLGRRGWDSNPRIGGYPITSLAGRPDQPDSGTSPASADATHQRGASHHGVPFAPLSRAIDTSDDQGPAT